MNNPVWPVSIKGVLMRERRVLLLRNPRMEWELPGGRLEIGEAPQQCLVREISEECGLDVRVLSPLLIEPFEVVAGRYVLIIAYGCATADDLEPVMSDEHEGFRWISVEDLDAHQVPAVYIRAIRAMVV